MPHMNVLSESEERRDRVRKEWGHHSKGRVGKGGEERERERDGL